MSPPMAQGGWLAPSGKPKVESDEEDQAVTSVLDPDAVLQAVKQEGVERREQLVQKQRERLVQEQQQQLRAVVGSASASKGD